MPTPSPAHPIALAISASSELCSVAVRGRDGAVHTRQCPARQQSRDFTGLLDGLLAAAGAGRQVEALYLDRGPGSYTGLRMALTFARVLAAFGEQPVRVATSLELLALAAWRRAGVATTTPVRPILDARRDRWHTARIEWRDGKVHLTQAPQALPIARAREAIGTDELVLADASVRPQLDHAVRHAALPPIEAADLFDVALTTATITAEQLEPLYLMGPYTE